MLNIKTPNIPKYHWKREPADPRDHTYDPAALGTVAPTLPTSVDLRSKCSPIEDQGQLGSCTGNAIAGLIEYLDRKANKNLDVSRLFIKAVNKYGAPLESLWPYLITRYATRPSTAAYTDALKRKAGAYQKITNRVQGIKTALSQGYPAVIGFDVYESFETQAVANTGMMPYPRAGEQLLGGHAVAIVGYNDTLNGGRFICRNSWGTGWGDRGYFYMPYQVIANANMSDDFWIITSVSNP
jgi:C1A family cysteine protease